MLSANETRELGTNGPVPQTDAPLFQLVRLFDVPASEIAVYGHLRLRVVQIRPQHTPSSKRPHNT